MSNVPVFCGLPTTYYTEGRNQVLYLVATSERTVQMAREKLCLGVDIGASGIKLCQLRRQRDEIALEHFAQAPLPPNAVLDGNIMNPTQVREVLEGLLSGLKTKNKQVAFSVSGHSVIIRKITLPQMTTEELEESLPFEAAQFIPFDVNDVYLDGQVLSRYR